MVKQSVMARLTLWSISAAVRLLRRSSNMRFRLGTVVNWIPVTPGSSLTYRALLRNSVMALATTEVSSSKGVITARTSSPGAAPRAEPIGASDARRAARARRRAGRVGRVSSMRVAVDSGPVMSATIADSNSPLLIRVVNSACIPVSAGSM